MMLTSSSVCDETKSTPCLVVGVVLLALVLTALEVVVLHLGAHVPQVVAEL